jgi:hypothetical protein
MANVSRVNGFKPVKHITGAPYNGQANIYEVPAGETIPVFVGDLVILSNSAATEGYPAVETVGVGTAVASGSIVGAVVGIINTKLDPINGKMSTGSIALDTPQYRAASTKTLVLVADAPDLIFEAQADAAVALADPGLNYGIVGGDGAASLGSTTTGLSGMQVDVGQSATTATLPLQLVGHVKRVDNEPATTYNRVLVRINTHAFGSVGVAGVA